MQDIFHLSADLDTASPNYLPAHFFKNLWRITSAYDAIPKVAFRPEADIGRYAQDFNAEQAKQALGRLLPIGLAVMPFTLTSCLGSHHFSLTEDPALALKRTD